MSSRNDILDNIKRHTTQSYEMPEMKIKGIQYSDKISKFIEVSRFVGGDAVVLEEGKDINQKILSLYPNAKKIASNLSDISIANINPDTAITPQELNGTDLAIVEGEIGVAENGCVWIPQNVKHRTIYFIAEYLVIILNKEKLVNNMHEAYEQLTFDPQPFGVFISGPSKTADIEQALVVGAHGAKGVTVILK